LGRRATPMDGPIHDFLRLFTELDQFLAEFVRDHGTLTYALLFAIVFCETGLVVLPFLPGDSLLFAAGAITVRDVGIDPWITAIVIFIAAVLGDAVNYHIGRWIGPAAFSGRFRWLRRDHLERTQRFFERYGGRAVVLARFVPIVRTFAPFVAGVGAMRYRRFAVFTSSLSACCRSHGSGGCTDELRNPASIRRRSQRFVHDFCRR